MTPLSEALLALVPELPEAASGELRLRADEVSVEVPLRAVLSGGVLRARGAPRTASGFDAPLVRVGARWVRT